MNKQKIYIGIDPDIDKSGNDDDEYVTPIPIPTPKYEEYIYANTEAILSKLEFTIHKGETPPNVVGKYFGETIKVTKTTIAFDNLPYYDKVGEMTYNLFDQKTNKTISSNLFCNILMG